jgi:asparagine synthase (glutamine-hydrolysing)
MCGINGIAYKHGQVHDEKLMLSLLDKMNDAIIHRGPDDAGTYSDDSSVAMGMRRLSVIDLSTGHQPISNEKNTITIIFNGEIYNYKKLREELVAEGVSFTTSSDTEVILKLYEKHGEKCVERLNGMFAFSIHDTIRKKVFIARDRFGEKPLYYSMSKGMFIWASELKSIVKIDPELKQISPQALSSYFALSYIPAPLTIYRNVFKLKPGYTLTLDTVSMTTDIRKYWDINLSQDENQLSYDEAKKQLRTLLFDSIEKRMISDVPLGVFLSGGVDSSIVAAVMSKVSNKSIKTFSVGYVNRRYDESRRAKMVSYHIKSDHHQYTLDYKEVFDTLDKVILNYDEPFADSSSLPTYFVSQKARQEVKVALTGDGGDEVFGGYNKYLIHTYGKLYRSLVPGFVRNNMVKPVLELNILKGSDSKSALSKTRKFVSAVNNGTVDDHLNVVSLGFHQHELGRLLKSDNLVDYKEVLKQYIDLPEGTEASPLKIARYIDKQISLEGDMLVKVDRASMLTSLECRAPFLDHRLMELTYNMPDKFLISGNNKKRILKETFEDLLPYDFFNAPKVGFEIPIAHWLRDELKEDLIQTLSADNLNQHQLFNNQYISELVHEHVDLNINHANKLWTLYCFQKWYIHNSNDNFVKC